MTRSEISEAELVDIARLAISVMNRLGNLTDWLEKFTQRGGASTTELENTVDAADNARLIAIELSDKVDALCDFIRRNQPQ